MGVPRNFEEWKRELANHPDFGLAMSLQDAIREAMDNGRITPKDRLTPIYTKLKAPRIKSIL